MRRPSNTNEGRVTVAETTVKLTAADARSSPRRTPALGNSWLTSLMRRDLRLRVEQRQLTLVAAAPGVEQRVHGALRALADCARWLGASEDARREINRRRHLREAGSEALSFLVAALSGERGSAFVLDEIEQGLAGFAVRAESGGRNPTAGESAPADVSTALHETSAALAMIATGRDAREQLLRAAASASLIAENG